MRPLTDLGRAMALVWRADERYTLVTVALAATQGALPSAQLWITKLLLDAVTAMVQGGGRTSQLLFLASLQATLMLMGSIIGTVQNTTYTLLGDVLRNHISLKVLHKTSGLEISFFEDDQFYNRMQNAYQEASSRPLEIVTQLASLMQISITLSSAVFLLLSLHWAILPLIVLSTLPGVIVQNRYGQQNYWLLRWRAPEMRKQQYVSTLLMSDRFIKEIRVFNLERHFLGMYESLFAKFFRQNRELLMKRNVRAIIAAICNGAGWFGAIAYAVIRIAERSISVGDFVMYSQAISLVQSQTQALLGGFSALHVNLLFIRNLFEFLSLPARDLSSGKQWTEPINEIEFRDVSFRYPGTDRLVLRNVSFSITTGHSLALVGKNGAGKTTIIKLLCRLYEPSSGSILVNGKDISDYSPQSVQEQIGVLFQDFASYCLTARENIGLGQVDKLSDTVAIKAAAQASESAAIIEALPNGYETMLGRVFEGGVQLSGGEWQKVALARTQFREGRVVVLDEPTASLDAQAEYEFFQQLLRGKPDRITLIISHRFSTVRTAEQILVFDGGGCIEVGSHDDLMMLDGQYAKMFKLQARGYESSVSAEHLDEQERGAGRVSNR